MKKTIKININGLIFHLDDDAYEKLRSYLDHLNTRFSKIPEGKEIIGDIEARIAELFQEKVSEEKQVVSLIDVEEVIAVLGEPDEMIDEEDQEESHEKEPHYRYHRRFGGRRMYRDPDHAVVGGVCSGLGEYLNIDPIILRILFIIAFLVYGTGFFLYIVLWMILPAAKTTAEKLEMKGERITVSNIEKSIKSEYSNVKDNFHRMKDTEGYRKSRSVLADFFEGLGRIILFILKIFAIIFGSVFVITGLAVLIGLVGTLTVGLGWVGDGWWGWPDVGMHDFFYLFADSGEVTMGILGLFLVIAVPILALIYGGIKIVFRFKSNDKIIGLTALTFFIMGIVLLSIVAINKSVEFKSYGRDTQSLEYVLPSNYLHIKAVANDGDNNYTLVDFDNQNEFLFRVDTDDRKILGQAKLDIQRGYKDEVEILVRKAARGANRLLAEENAREISYTYHHADSLLLLDKYFELPDDEKWRDHELRIIVKVPEGTRIYLDSSLKYMLYDVDNEENMYDEYMIDKYWVMESRELSLEKAEN